MTWVTKGGEWVRRHDKGWSVGLTKDLVEDLGDVTFVELPALGRDVVEDGVAATLEAVKAATDVHSPLAGRVVLVNQRLVAEPALLNRDAEGEGWLFVLEGPGEAELAAAAQRLGWQPRGGDS